MQFHRLSLGLAVTTAELRTSKSLGTFEGDLLSYIFINYIFGMVLFFFALFFSFVVIMINSHQFTHHDISLKKPILFPSYVLTQPKERHWESAMDASTAFTSWAASFLEGIFVVCWLVGCFFPFCCCCCSSYTI